MGKTPVELAPLPAPCGAPSECSEDTNLVPESYEKGYNELKRPRFECRTHDAKKEARKDRRSNKRRIARMEARATTELYPLPEHPDIPFC